MFSKNQIPSFSADKAVDVHKAVLGAFSGATTDLYNVTCQFPATGLGPAFDGLYPFKGPGQSATETLDELVDWWQAPWVGSESMPDFNHGSRINGVDSDWQQIQAVVDALKDRPYTTKANIVLQHHRPGFAKAHGHPAMCEVLVCLQKQVAGDDRLDVTAIFRKQEMRYWWIVNVREVAAIQEAIIIGLKGVGIKAQPGMITTFTFRAVVGKVDVPPLVAVHALDRVAHVKQEVIPRLCADLVKAKASPEDKDLWHYYLDDLQPSIDRDPDGFPVCVAGLKTLGASVDLVANTRPSSIPALGKVGQTKDPREHLLRDLSKILNDLTARNTKMVKKLRDGRKNEVSDDDYNDWRQACESLIGKAKKQINLIMGS